MERLRVLLLLAVVFAVVPDGCPQNLEDSPFVNFDCSTSSPQIVHTHSTGVSSDRKTWPWMALVGKKSEGIITFQCAGMLINEQWVLTQADCAADTTSTLVRLGEYDSNDDNDGANHEDFIAAEIVSHPAYSHPSTDHGLKLIKLGSKVAFQRYISPVCLPWGSESRKIITGHSALLLTFGNVHGNTHSNTVQKEIEMTVFSKAHCDSSYSMIKPMGIGEGNLCAGHPDGGKDACKGDSGAPLVTVDASGRYVAAGIVSYGVGCGDKRFPGVYLNLRYPPYLAWIKEIAF